MMTIEKDPQVCVDEHFQHEVASRDPALVCSREKSQRHLAHWDQDHHDQSLVGDTFRWVRGCWQNIKIFSPFRHLESLLMSASILVELMIVRRQSLPIPCSSLSPWLLSRFWRESSIWEWTEEAAVGGGSTFQTETPVELAITHSIYKRIGKGTSGTFGEEMKRLLLNSGCFSRCSRQRHCLGWFCPGNRLNPLIFQ